MALRKVVSLKNVGRFKSLAARGNVDFKRQTLVYGSNGHGKTTLVGVLRSLATGDRAYVDERATLGGEPPEAEILVDSGLAKFSNGSWSLTTSGLEVFDTTFVNENVFTGEHVGPEHRKNLYEVVVGASAVALVRAIDKLDSDARKAAREIRETEAALRNLIQAPFSIDDFVKLQPEPNLADRIRERTTQLNAVRKQREIIARPQLDPIPVPSFPRDVLDVLPKSVAQLSKQTETRVRQHLQRLDHRGEAWIRQGVEYTKDDDECPFCGQDTTAADLIKLYGEFFSTAYRDHLVEVERAVNRVDQLLRDDALAALGKRLLENDGRIQGWSDLANLDYARYGIESIEGTWKHLRSAVTERLKRKAANPGETIEIDAQLVAAAQDFDAACEALRVHNGAITRANEEIAELKRKAAATRAEELEVELRRLRNMEIRQTPEAEKLVGQLLEARAKRTALETEKRIKKEELEGIAASVLGKYQAAINRLLAAFGANFKITNTRPSFAGGKASSTYQLELNNTTLEIGDPSTPRGKPCFRTALSTGDKSTLALAFFLARLEQEEGLSDRCVIIDDPLSSLDSFRIACTQQEISAVTRRAAQTVVLSHDAFFLKGIYDTSDRPNTSCLQIVRDGESHALRPWDVAEYFLREAHQEHFLLRSYLADGPPESGDLTSIARAIRPYLEGHLRHRFPDEFGPTEWLGEFIGKMREAGAGSPLAGMKPKLPELEAINEYAKKFHHTDPSPRPRPTDAELQPWVKRALAFVQNA